RLYLLRALVLFAWSLLVVLVGMEAALRLHPQAEWPQVAGFSTTYNTLLAVFAINTGVLTALLVQRDWFERVPRNAEHRVAWLLYLVLIWLGLHLFFLFHIAGAFSGALGALPVLSIIAMLVLLPGSAGWGFAVYMAAGYLLVAALAKAAVIHPQGALATAFAPGGLLFGLSWLALFAVALAVGLWGRGRWAEATADEHPARRVDPDTGLFRAAFLQQRLQRELRRGRRQQSAATLLMLDVDEGRGGVSEADRVRPYADHVLATIRLQSDTPAHYAAGRIALLMPATDGAAAQAFSQRLVGTLQDAGLRLPKIAGAVVESAAVDVMQWAAAAENALRKAPEGGALQLARL
ncbi:MAG: GGDEF domain-containing protein, partial [Algiphilus sp.]